MPSSKPMLSLGASAKLAKLTKLSKSKFSKLTKMPKGATENDKIVRWILVIALIALMIYTLIYIFNINKLSTEAFLVGEEIPWEQQPKYFVVYVYSIQCPYCIKFSPTFKNYQEEKRSDALITTVSYDKESAPAEVLAHVKAFPTVLVYKGKKLINSTVGNMDLEQLSNFVSNSINKEHQE